MSEQIVLFGGPQDGREVLVQGQPLLIFIPVQAEDHSSLLKLSKHIYKRTFESDSKNRRIYKYEGKVDTDGF